MMGPIHDLRCTECGHVDLDVETRRNEPLPACSSCSGPTKITLEHWPTTSNLQVKLFAKREFGKGIVATTKQEEEILLAPLKEKYPGEQFYMEPPDVAKGKARIEEIRHKAELRKREVGVDQTTIEAHRKQVAAARKEAEQTALARNEDPTQYIAAATQAVPSPAAMARTKAAEAPAQLAAGGLAKTLGK